MKKIKCYYYLTKQNNFQFVSAYNAETGAELGEFLSVDGMKKLLKHIYKDITFRRVYAPNAKHTKEGDDVNE